MSGKKREEEEEDHERWLSSYSGFVTLLFAFFTVMYAMAESNGNKIVAAVKSMTIAFNAIETGPIFPQVSPGSRAMREVGQGLNIEGVSVTEDERGIVLSIASKIAFEPGKADLFPEMRPVLNWIAERIVKMPHPIRVEGHTDNVPIQSSHFPSNWELSVARATSVVRFFEAYGIDPKRLSASGYGEFRPVASNDTEEGRAKNRRIDVLLLGFKGID